MENKKRLGRKPVTGELRRHRLSFRVNDEERQAILGYFGDFAGARDFLVKYIQKHKVLGDPGGRPK